jgi:hypothetical protein
METQVPGSTLARTRHRRYTFLQARARGHLGRVVGKKEVADLCHRQILQRLLFDGTFFSLVRCFTKSKDRGSSDLTA